MAAGPRGTGRGRRARRAGRHPRPAPRPVPTLATVRPVAMNRLRPGVVVWAHVTFRDGTGEKARPVVVVGTRGREVVVRPITSSPRRLEWPDRYTELADLAPAGATRPCAVAADPIVLDRIEVIGVAGALSDGDAAAVLGIAAGGAPGRDGDPAPCLALAC